MSKAISYSRYSMHNKCPQSYHWKYNEERPTTYDPGPAATRGTMIHKTIEDFINKESETIHEDITKKWLPYVDELRARGAAAEVDFCFTNQWEQTAWEAEDGNTRGSLDMLLLRPDHTAQVDDWKTGRIYDDHAEQRSLYGLYVFKAFPDVTDVQVNSVYVDKNKKVTTTMSRVMVPTYTAVWEKRFERIRLPMYPPRPGSHCNWCSFSKKKGGECKVG